MRSVSSLCSSRLRNAWAVRMPRTRKDHRIRSDCFHSRSAAIVASALPLDAGGRCCDSLECAASLSCWPHRSIRLKRCRRPRAGSPGHTPRASRLKNICRRPPARAAPFWITTTTDGWTSIWSTAGSATSTIPSRLCAMRSIATIAMALSPTSRKRPELPLEAMARASRWATTTATASPTST